MEVSEYITNLQLIAGAQLSAVTNSVLEVKEGTRSWRRRLASFATSILTYPHQSLVSLRMTELSFFFLSHRHDHASLFFVGTLPT